MGGRMVAYVIGATLAVAFLGWLWFLLTH